MSSSKPIKLIHPDPRYQETFLKALKEFQAEGLSWHVELNYQQIASDFAGFVQHKLDRTTLKDDILVPETELWAMMNDEYVGRISIRHRLSDSLREFGGNIGYDTVPSYRGIGVATQMLAKALPVARELGLSQVLLTCDDDNQASIRVIEKNGGVLKEIKIYQPLKSLKRYYWIDLT